MDPNFDVLFVKWGYIWLLPAHAESPHGLSHCFHVGLKLALHATILLLLWISSGCPKKGDCDCDCDCDHVVGCSWSEFIGRWEMGVALGRGQTPTKFGLDWPTGLRDGGCWSWQASWEMQSSLEGSHWRSACSGTFGMMLGVRGGLLRLIDWLLA